MTLRSQKQKRYDRLAVLDFIEQYQRKNEGYSPSQRDLADALEMSSPAPANRTIAALRKAGLIETKKIKPGIPLRVRITETGQAELERWRARQRALSRQQQRGAA